MDWDSFFEGGPHEKFLDAVAEGDVEFDPAKTRAETYAVGEKLRIWFHHAGKDFAGVSKLTRKKLVAADDRRLVHLFVLETRDDFYEFIKHHDGDLSSACQDFTWFAVPTSMLEDHSTDGSPDKFNVNAGDFKSMAVYRHDSRGILN